jgi:hypothetical protein
MFYFAPRVLLYPTTFFSQSRNNITQQFIKKLKEKYPKHNVVMCHPKHVAKWQSVQGKDWGQDHVEFDIKLGGTIGYDVYWGSDGEFINEGDRGYLNVSHYLCLEGDIPFTLRMLDSGAYIYKVHEVNKEKGRHFVLAKY